jgi:alcohol dehydrogenase
MILLPVPDMIAPFSIARLPRIEFGAGTLGKLPDIAGGYGTRLLLVTGQSSFATSTGGAWLVETFRAQGFAWEHVRVSEEPSPQLVDGVVAQFRHERFDVVVGIGGGSALDAAKAIAGLLRPGNSVMDHLEGVGPERPYRGPATPFIAVPTTAGTGSEATKNAVLSVHGEAGFKKSFRDDRLVAQWAILDPDLLAGCPPSLIAANGMDAFTQLLESFVSIRANPMTDALARSGIEAVRDGLLDWYAGGARAAQGRSRMAYASLVSGICLAQTGLGSVHGLAAPLGAFFPISHGVACGTLVGAATRVNIEAIARRDPQSAALPKYAEVGRCLGMQEAIAAEAARALLVTVLADWQDQLDLPRLAGFGIAPHDVPRIVAASRGSSMKTNPVVLTDAEVAELVNSRL